MRFLNFTAHTPAEDLALEEAIQLGIEEGSSPETWRVWSARSPAVILGTGQESAREANLDAAGAEKVSVLRRHSGGGAVVIGPGKINYSAVCRYENLPGSETIRGAMEEALRPLIATLNSMGLATQFAGHSDLAVLCSDGIVRKIAGNSQARKRHSVLVHGTLLADPDWRQLECLLRFPSSVPDYRAGRGHRDFLTSLRECGAPFGFDDFVRRLAHHVHGITLESSAPSAEETARGRQLLHEKYARDEWNFRR